MSDQPTQPMPKPGQWCHIEIPTSDAEASKEFYGNVLGWTFQDVPMGEGTYTLYMTGDGGIGGGIWSPPDDVPPQVVNYAWVEDLATTCAKIEASGGRVLIAEREVPGTGWLSLVADPDGNVFGLWKQAVGGH